MKKMPQAYTITSVSSNPGARDRILVRTLLVMREAMKVFRA